LYELERRHAVEVRHLVEGAVHGAFRRGAVVADDVEDERVVEHAELLDRVDDAADVVVGVLQESGVHLHLAFEHGLQLRRHVVPGRYLGVSRGQVRVVGQQPEFALPGECLLTLLIPSLCEAPTVLLRPFGRHVMRRVGRTGGEVHEERAVGHERLLRPDPVDRVIGQVLRQVVPLFGRRGWFDGRRPLVQRGLPLVVLAADEAVEGLEPTAARRPGVERSHG
jgi:hypothetical protein